MNILTYHDNEKKNRSWLNFTLDYKPLRYNIFININNIIYALACLHT